MSPAPLHRVEELLAELLDRSPEEQGVFLDEACRDDPALRREVLELLGLHDQAASFFEDLSRDIVTAAPLEIENADRPQIQIGPYRTLEAIGRGGMGVVYRAERVDGAFDQKVALKLLHRDMETPELRARFLAERQLLARLSHPSIARLQDGGVTEEGRPYFVMELVDGQPITRYCERHELSVEKALRLFLHVIHAVSYLHRNLVVHRDLKPSNIFVDQSGQPKLLDFGIAKLLADAPDGGGPTRTGELLMTPEYAAPEQLEAAPVTTATDVYALGVVLYELLVGRRPYDGTAGAIPRDLPPTPSSALRSLLRDEPPAGPPAASPSFRAALARRRISADLDNICLMALRPEPDARYPSAEQLGQDIERFLEGEPVRARKGTLAYRLGKFARRHRRGVVAAAGGLALLVAGFVHERGLRDQAEQARIDAQRQATKAEAVSGFLGNLLSSASPAKAQGSEVTVADVLEQATARLADRTELAGQPLVEAAVRRTIGNTYMSLGRHTDAREHLERAVELLGGLESRDPEALAAAADLAVVYQNLTLHDRAEAIVRRVLEVRIETLGEAHPLSLDAMNRLGNILFAAGRYDELEPIDRRTLQIRRRVLGPDHPDTLRSLNGLGATLFTAGRYAEAAELFEEALAGQRRQLGDSHPDTLALESNLAATYLEIGRYREAESLLREALSGRIRVMGPDHADTALSRHNLGATLLQEGRYEEAAEQLQLAMATRERLPGDQKWFLFSRSHLADVRREQGRLEEAEALYVSTLKTQRERFGIEDEDTLKTMAGLAELRLRQGRLDAGEKLIVETLAVQTRVRGETHADTILSLTTLARIHNRQGRFASALEASEKAIETGGPALGEEHPLVLAATLERARALVGQRQPEAAREDATRVYHARLGLLGAEHPDTIEARRLLASLSSPR
jgi:tetratricopeptide (TPR) repeat protein